MDTNFILVLILNFWLCLLRAHDVGTEQHGCGMGLYAYGNDSIKCHDECHCMHGVACNSSGYCPGECDTRYRGIYCNQYCRDGRFWEGDICSGVCRCDILSECDISNGRCGASGCQIGWGGDNCQECVSGVFGPDCSSACHCLNNAMCSTSGTCSHGCAFRYTGPTCQQTCDEGYFLENSVCTGVCRCALKSQCRVTDGMCLNGVCVDGRRGASCQQCAEKTFGNDCEMTCHCKEYSPCDVTGACEYGCDVGYYGDTCQRACDEGHFLKSGKCVGICHCKTMSQCRVTDGVCLDSVCEDGRTGTDCQECEGNKYGDNCELTCHCVNKIDCLQNNGHLCIESVPLKTGNKKNEKNKANLGVVVGTFLVIFAFIILFAGLLFYYHTRTTFLQKWNNSKCDRVRSHLESGISSPKTGFSSRSDVNDDIISPNASHVYPAKSRSLFVDGPRNDRNERNERNNRKERIQGKVDRMRTDHDAMMYSHVTPMRPMDDYQIYSPIQSNQHYTQNQIFREHAFRFKDQNAGLHYDEPLHSSGNFDSRFQSTPDHFAISHRLNELSAQKCEPPFPDYNESGVSRYRGRSSPIPQASSLCEAMHDMSEAIRQDVFDSHLRSQNRVCGSLISGQEHNGNNLETWRARSPRDDLNKFPTTHKSYDNNQRVWRNQPLGAHEGRSRGPLRRVGADENFGFDYPMFDSYLPENLYDGDVEGVFVERFVIVEPARHDAGRTHPDRSGPNVRGGVVREIEGNPGQMRDVDEYAKLPHPEVMSNVQGSSDAATQNNIIVQDGVNRLENPPGSSETQVTSASEHDHIEEDENDIREDANDIKEDEKTKDHNSNQNTNRKGENAKEIHSVEHDILIDDYVNDMMIGIFCNAVSDSI